MAEIEKLRKENGVLKQENEELKTLLKVKEETIHTVLDAAFPPEPTGQDLPLENSIEIPTNKFRRKAALVARQKIHRNTDTENKRIATPGKYPCKCGKLYAHSSNRRRHIRKFNDSDIHEIPTQKDIQSSVSSGNSYTGGALRTPKIENEK